MRKFYLAIAIFISAFIPGGSLCPVDDDTLPSRYRGVEYESGCTCREYLKSHATCYDPDKCVKFPRRFKTTLACFRFATTGVSEILAGDLKNFHHLTGLHIEANLNLRKLEPGLFSNMSNLINLSISYNPNLVGLEEGVFEGLTNLEYLQIGRNGFANIQDFTLSLRATHMPRLSKLFLKELYCPEVRQNDLINLRGSKLERLYFIDSQIEYIHPDAFSHLKNLKSLCLGENLLNVTTIINVIKQMERRNIWLEALNLFASGFKKQLPDDLLVTIANSRIKTLSAARNQFDVLYDNSFPTMPSIETIDLSSCVITSVSLNAFSSFPNLKYLLLTRNKFTFVPDGVLIPMLKILDLSENTYETDIKSYFTLEPRKFVNMSNLETLHLSSNNIRKLSMDSFVGLKNLKNLHLEDCTLFFVADRSFVHLENLEYLNLARNIFPTRRFNKDIFDGLKRLKHLRLANCKINCIPNQSNVFEHLDSLEHLDLSNNQLLEINPALLLPIGNLKIFRISGNLIATWNQQVFSQLNHIDSLIAFDNKLTVFTNEMLNDFSKLNDLDVSSNIFHCDCTMVETFQTLSSGNRSHVFKLLANSSAMCLGSENHKTYSIQDYYNKTSKSCEIANMEKLLHYLIPSVIFLLLLILVGILSYFYRWHIRYWMFLTKLSLTRRAQFHKRRNVQCHANYLYDAFVSYSNEDRNFVVRLVSMLENYEPFLKLCVYERDFEIGTIISESVLECVSMSRKTLLIISNSYIKSQWCTWETQVAEHHRLFFENEYGECVNDSIVMVKLGNISGNNISPMLKYLMKTRIYLQWDPADNKQKQFWDKLRNALSPSDDDNRVNSKL